MNSPTWEAWEDEKAHLFSWKIHRKYPFGTRSSIPICWNLFNVFFRFQKNHFTVCAKLCIPKIPWNSKPLGILWYTVYYLFWNINELFFRVFNSLPYMQCIKNSIPQKSVCTQNNVKFLFWRIIQTVFSAEKLSHL